MFDLSKEIIKWRKILLEKQMCHISDMDELESHLRDEIDRLKIQGLSEHEAFLVGTHRLGKPDALADEFAKVNKSLWLRTKCFWGGYAVFAYIAASYASGAISYTLLLLATSLGLRGYAAGTLELVSRMIIFSLIVFLWFVIATKKDPDGEHFSKAIDSLKGKTVFLTVALSSIMALLVTRIVLRAVVLRIVGPQDFGLMVMPMDTLGGLSSALITPLILMAVLICLRPTKYRKLA